MRRWKLLKPQLGHVQSPGRGRFLDGGKGVSSGGPPGGWEPAARSRTREEEGATSMARSLRARPFMLSDSAACTRSQVSSRVRLGVVAMQGRQAMAVLWLFSLSCDWKRGNKVYGGWAGG